MLQALGSFQQSAFGGPRQEALFALRPSPFALRQQAYSTCHPRATSFTPSWIVRPTEDFSPSGRLAFHGIDRGQESDNWTTPIRGTPSLAIAYNQQLRREIAASYTSHWSYTKIFHTKDLAVHC